MTIRKTLQDYHLNDFKYEIIEEMRWPYYTHHSFFRDEKEVMNYIGSIPVRKLHFDDLESKLE